MGALERSSKLPDEIIDAHQSRADLLKWKFILVAALGAVALGLGEKSSPAPLLLALIPWVCLYVDLLCSNLNLRQIAIGTFYARSRKESYECFVQQHRSVFDMEDWALYDSTYIICIILSAIGLALTNWPPHLENEASLRWWQEPVSQGRFITLAAVVALSLSWGVGFNCRKRRKIIEAVGNRGEITSLLHPHYTREEFTALERFLAQKGCFTFRSLPNGLFPAAAVSPKHRSGYQYVWVRDNVHIAHAHFICGDMSTAARNAATLMRYFQKHIQHFQDIITMPARKSDPMKRPHIRFDGEKLAEIDQKWSHAQNDALGYFLWFYCKLAQENFVACGDPELECLAQFPLYFEAIEYWQDEDSGHWEETRKVSASSIGTVIAGLREFEGLMNEKQLWPNSTIAGHDLTPDRLKNLSQQGADALDKILPCESVEPGTCYRRYDSALLFLIYPLEVLPWDKARAILEDINAHLQGDYGIRRYPGDSYWFPDCKSKWKFRLRRLTADFSTNMSKRDAFAQFGAEAQWCIFDPIISVIYGQKYLASKGTSGDNTREFLRLQIEYLNRAVGQLTDGENGLPEFRSPEAYYLEKGRYVPNDNTPLLWSQANLWLAVNQMRKSLE